MKLKGSFTLEGAIIIPIMLFMIAFGMKNAIDMYQQTIAEHEQDKLVEMWLVDDFYRLQIVNEVKDKVKENNDK